MIQYLLKDGYERWTEGSTRDGGGEINADDDQVAQSLCPSKCTYAF